MANITTATYVKKLVKIIYEKQKEIEELKKDIRNHSLPIYQRNQNISYDKGDIQINDRLETQMFQASAQLREVTAQMNAMQQKIIDLQLGLQEQTIKNHQIQSQIQDLRLQNTQLVEKAEFLEQQNTHLKQQNGDLMKLLQNIKHDYTQSVKKYTILLQEMENVRHQDEILKSQNQSLQSQINSIQSALKIQSEKEVQIQLEQISKQGEKIQQNILKIQILKHELNNQMQINRTLESQLQMRKGEIEMHSSQYLLVSEKLKDFQEFAFEISQYIEAAFIKHCSVGLRSSKRLIKEEDGHRFQHIFKRFTQIQNWMDLTSQKLQKLAEQYQLPNQTLQNLSHIMNSFEDKLKYCDLTEELQKQKDQMIKNEQELIKNLQNQLQKSEEHERTKLVQLGQVKQVLKMTKQVNRELMDEINRKQYIISECRKAYQSLIGSKNTNEYRNIRQLLGIKNA